MCVCVSSLLARIDELKIADGYTYGTCTSVQRLTSTHTCTCCRQSYNVGESARVVVCYSFDAERVSIWTVADCINAAGEKKSMVLAIY